MEILIERMDILRRLMAYEFGLHPNYDVRTAEENASIDEAIRLSLEVAKKRPSLSWPRPIPVSERLPTAGKTYLAHGYLVPDSHRRPDDERIWIEAEWEGPLDSSDVAHWAAGRRHGTVIYLFDVDEYLPLPPKPE